MILREQDGFVPDADWVPQAGDRVHLRQIDKNRIVHGNGVVTWCERRDGAWYFGWRSLPDSHSLGAWGATTYPAKGIYGTHVRRVIR